MRNAWVAKTVGKDPTMTTKTKTMRAGVFDGGRRIVLQELPIPTPGAGEVLLRVVACGVCGTDHHIFTGQLADGVAPPVVPGHEIAARVAAVGDGVRGLAEGDFCAVDPVIGCGRCGHCREGLTNHCADPTVVGYGLNGGFAQYVLLPAGKVVPMPAAVGPAGGVICETLACVLRGYDRLGFRAGGSVVILGAGGVGLLWAQLLVGGPRGVLIQTEIEPFRRDKAAALGADVVIDPNAEDLGDRVRREAPGGVDYLIDATGSPDAVQQALDADLLAPGGTAMLFGVCPIGTRLTFEPHEMFAKEITILGSKMPPGTLDRAAGLIAAGRIDCDAIVTTTLPLGDLSAAIEGFTAHRGSRVKVAIDPWLE